MIKFYTNKELSQKFNINLARWKRWSREFLPPDPLGGYRSGYARQYNPNEAFTVVLGGHLVGDLKFSVPEAGQILRDLNQWLVEHNFYFDFAGCAQPVKKSSLTVIHYQIAIISRNIFQPNDAGLSYLVKSMITDEVIDLQGVPVRQERFIESAIDPQERQPDLSDCVSYRILNISTFHEKILEHLQDG